MSSTNIDKFVPSLYQCVETRSIEALWLLSQPILHLRLNLFVISEMCANMVVSSRLNMWKLLYAIVRAVRRIFRKYPLQFLDSVLDCSGCMGSGILRMKQLAWKFSANCFPKFQQNFTVRCRIHIFTTLLKMNQRHSLRIPKHGKHKLPRWWRNLNLLVVGELGCFHFIEATFYSGWWWCTHDSSSVTILLSISSPSSAYRKRCCKDRSIPLVFTSILQFSGHPPCTHFPELQTIMHYAVC
jgi:hypothetical protein